MIRPINNRRVLTVIPSTTATVAGNKLHLDRKAVDGLAQYASRWNGTVRCIMRKGDEKNIVFGESYDPGDLPFTVDVVPEHSRLTAADVQGAAVVLRAATIILITTFHGSPRRRSSTSSKIRSRPNSTSSGWKKRRRSGA
ncbi:hypothetical protein GGR88_001745 [Sphingomonas jejuensis]|uniref:Uncharacterized protein n=1 Tax=Sphingomonas jejuensis TaxID=904715 RepID=A0ABX0XLM4_9SPHN|nr:hypothetical protein [Sphingomonas jejuensis]NJC34271.1 hypothetical protein [Sphingomonas jejuensis]